ncbi:hypothetical protein [Actinomadura harenae]|uniref:Uncharacterized protein n=1 Tax=Actinomadura harenae TaxID=2483351 RepID=A0A3M2MDE3_9ACTN|nr:hypothetical protein [Actinomadura harenae]RMI47587.1 hypothetical protein EBO15_01415 [Actinomadura harenae]
MTYHDDDNPSFCCPWTNCRCTHQGCTAGWIDRTRPDGSTYAAPCPTCRPEVARHLADRSKSLPKLRRELPTLARPSRALARHAHPGDDQ